MTLTHNTEYVWQFHSKRNAEQAKDEILDLFSMEPDNYHEWSEQDICEQVRKIISRWDNV